MSKLAIIEKFLSKVEGLSAADIRTIRTEMAKRLAKNTTTLGDQETDLICIGQLESLVRQKEADQFEAGLTEDQLHQLDKERLKKIAPGVGDKIAEAFLKKHAPWETDSRRVRRELAKAAPPIESTPTKEQPEEDERGSQAYDRLDPHNRRLARKDD